MHWLRRPSKDLNFPEPSLEHQVQVLASGPQGSGFSLFFFFHGLEGPGFGFFTGVEGPGFRFFTGFGDLVRTFLGRRGPRVHVFGLEGPGFGFFHWRGGARVQVFHWLRIFHCFFFFHGLEGPGFGFFTGVQVFHWLRRPSKDWRRGARVQVFHWLRRPSKDLNFPQPSLVQVLASGPQGSDFFTGFFFSRPRGARVRVFHWRRGATVQVFQCFSLAI